jgi:hypothetical protein
MTLAIENTQPARKSKNQAAFHQTSYSSVPAAFRFGMNEEVLRWGLVFSQGNGWNVTENRVKERLRFIASGLLRKIYGNRHRDKAKIHFIVFKHGSRDCFNEHFHALMWFDGQPHGWSDFRVAMTLKELDRKFIGTSKSEKPVWVDWDWTNDNRYHSYVSRFEQTKRGPSDNWFIM